MPFSFKPEIAQGGAPEQAPLAPAASFGNQSTQTIATRHVEEGRSFVQMILFVIFGAAVFVAGGLVGYKFYLSSQIEAKKATLASYESRLGSLPLEDMRKLSNRIKIINQLVREHPSVNVAFRIIEDSVENQITYDGFEMRYNDQLKSYSLKLQGVAPDYKSIAQQMDTFKRKPYTNYVQGVTVEGLSPDSFGRIGFSFKLPIQIAGLLPENVNLADGAAARIASSTQPVVVNGTSTQPTVSTSTTTQATSTQPGKSTNGTTTPPKR